MKKYILFTLTTALVGLCLVLVAKEGLSREAGRQDRVRVYNCKHYGWAINKQYGRHICPPTVNG